MTRTLRASFLALPLLALGAIPALAQNAPAATAPLPGAAAQAVGTACQADIKTLCASVQPGGGRIVQCLRDKKDQASPPCQAAVSALGKK